MHTRSMRALAAIATGLSLSVVLDYGLDAQSDAARRAATKEWPTYGHDANSTRFSPLTEITPANVAGLEVAWVYHMRPAQPDGRAAGPAATPARRAGRRRGAAGLRPRPRAGQRRLRIFREPGDAARRRRRDVFVDAVLPRRRARLVDGQGDLGVPVADGKPVDTRRRVPGPATARRRRKSCSARATRSSIRSTRRPASPTRHSATRASSASTRRKSCRGLPGRNSLSSPPIVYKNLVITGGTTQENPPLGPAGDVRAWDMRTGKLVWTFHSVPRPERKVTTRGRARAGRTVPASTSGGS